VDDRAGESPLIFQRSGFIPTRRLLLFANPIKSRQSLLFVKHIPLKVSLILVMLAGAALPWVVRAAPLTYVAPTMISLSSPATTLTIASGSIADALQVNATSVVITLSNTTGGAFTLLSPSYDLSVATSSGGGIATISCSSGTDTVVLLQSAGSAIYTVTPTTQNCAGASPPGITSVTATNVTTGSATITWTTNVPADSTVFYGTTAAYGATSTAPTLLTAHSILLANLNAGTLYHYAVASSEYSTSTTSGDNTFTTASYGSVSEVITVTQGANGTITPGSLDDVPSGAQETFSITPASGYQIADVLVDGMPVGAVASYTFSDVSVGHTITANFSLIPTTPSVVVSNGGGGSVAPVPATTTVPTTTSVTSSTTSGISSAAPSTASLQAELAALQAELQALLKQAGQSAATPASAPFVFTRGLSFGMTSNAVKQLQKFLAKNSALYPQGIVSGYFGTLTVKAVQRFQSRYGLAKPGQSVYGYVGPATRAKLNALIQNGLNP